MFPVALSRGFKQMSDRLAFLGGRAFPRLALTGLALVWLSGCSGDVSRFSDSGFANPFASQTSAAQPAAGAPANKVAAAPLAPPQTVASAPLPASSAKSQAVGGSAVGWTPAGGSPVIVGQGETLNSLSGRYGVPAAALLSANGLTSASEVKGGMRMIVPVYNAGAGRAVAKADERDRGASNKEIADSSTKRGKKKAEELASNSEPDSAKAKRTKAEEKAAEKKAKDDATKTVVAKAEPSKPAGKKRRRSRRPRRPTSIRRRPRRRPPKPTRPRPRPSSAGRRAGESSKASRPAATTASTFRCLPAPRCAQLRTEWSSMPATASRATAIWC